MSIPLLCDLSVFFLFNQLAKILSMSFRPISTKMNLLTLSTSRACIPSRSRHFFSAFHRYISLATPAHPPRPTPLSTPTYTQPHLSRQYPSPSHHRSATTSASPPQSTHYTLFPTTLPRGPPPTGPFEIDLPTLRREFLRLQSKSHPDLHSGANKARAEGTSALINEAYKTLSSPLLRAQYLLHLNGIDVAEDETAKIDDEELLMEVLEAREVIEGAEEEEDLEGVGRENEARIARSEGLLGGWCESGDWEAVAREVVRLRYWVNIREAVRGWEKGKPVVIHH